MRYIRAQYGEIENPSYTPLKLQAPSTPFRRTYCTQDFGCMYTGGAGEAAEGRHFGRDVPYGCGHCRRPGQAREGVLGRVSGRSWVSRACWEGPHPALGHPTPSAGVLPACRGGPRGALGVTGSWEGAAALGGTPADLDCGRGAECDSGSVWGAASRRIPEPRGRPRPRSATVDLLNGEGERGKMARAAVRGREGVRKMRRGRR